MSWKDSGLFAITVGSRAMGGKDLSGPRVPDLASSDGCGTVGHSGAHCLMLVKMKDFQTLGAHTKWRQALLRRIIGEMKK